MKYIKLLILFFLIIFNSNSLSASNSLINELKDGKKIIFIRHSYAPGNGDPNNFSINDCSTQRNLNRKGIQQSKDIGNFFKNNKIPIDRIYSSEWCRCKDTAFYAFKSYKTNSSLNSFYDSRFRHNKDQQIKDLKNFILNWDSKKNLVLITHYVVISEILDYNPSSGEIVISDRNFKKLGNIKIEY